MTYFQNTEATFKGCKKPNKPPNFVSESGSEYWYGRDKKGNYIIRGSDHWCKVKNISGKTVNKDCRQISTCRWHIKTKNTIINYNKWSNVLNSYFPKRNFLYGKVYLKNFKTIRSR